MKQWQKHLLPSPAVKVVERWKFLNRSPFLGSARCVPNSIICLQFREGKHRGKGGLQFSHLTKESQPGTQKLKYTGEKSVPYMLNLSGSFLLPFPSVMAPEDDWSNQDLRLFSAVTSAPFSQSPTTTTTTRGPTCFWNGTISFTNNCRKIFFDSNCILWVTVTLVTLYGWVSAMYTQVSKLKLFSVQ